MQIKTLLSANEKFGWTIIILMLITISSACRKEKPVNTEAGTHSTKRETTRLPDCGCDSIHNVKQREICKLDCH
jgi:hypothetical protein